MQMGIGGFCIGFDTKKLFDPKDKFNHEDLLELYKVDYHDDENMPVINLYESMNKESREFDRDLMTMITTKSIQWKYEDEYRLIFIDNPNSSIEIGLDSISEIILGIRINSENEKLILKIISKWENKPKLFRAKRAKGKFALECEQIS